MIRDLSTLLGPEHRGMLRRYFCWVGVYGVLIGISTAVLVPVIEALLEGDTARAVRWLIVVVVVGAGACVANWIQSMAGFNAALLIVERMHSRLGEHIVTLPLGWFDSEKAGGIAKTANSGTMLVAGLFAHLLGPIVVAVTTPVTIAIFMAFYDWRLGLITLIAAPLLLLVFRWGASLVASGDALVHEKSVVANNRVLEFARNQATLRAFGRTTGDYPPLEEALDEQAAAGRKSFFKAIVGILAGNFAVQVVFSALLVAAVAFVLADQLAAVPAIALMALIARAMGPLAETGAEVGVIRMAAADVRRLVEVFEVDPLPEPAAAAATSEDGGIELEAVRFGYDAERPVLRDVSLSVPPRSMTALVGASGSGKTTVTRLIARFWDVDAGAVRVGGVDVREQTTEQLMAQLAMVFQDVYLFDDTLEGNIRIGREDASDADVREAAHLAGVTEIVERLPHGWQTRVGEGGAALSGGERQRVSIARALLKDAPIVLLDEATAALDPENERFVQASLQALAQRSTVVVIAHRLPTVVAADQIVVLADGGVAERGTHDELLAARGAYSDFWASRRRAAGWRITDPDRAGV